ncbi:TIGR00180 family glycosyltransferase [Candidatus Pelagibacter sp.]|nr:TIGR00180 family glycosyltransferase [Candidatus Pelagibacter sp.]
MLSFTLIVPTKNRTSYIYNLLSYYSKTNVKFNILILDSSTGSFRKKNKEITKTFLNLRIKHKFIVGKPHEVVKKSKDLIKTKYCCLCGDDDYLFPKNIKKLINFLEKNNSFVGINGSCYLVRNYNETLSFSKYNLVNLTQEKAYIRCKNHILKYYNPHFSICRTSAFSDAIKLVNKSKYPHDIYNDELVLNLSLVCFGKFKSTSMTYMFRKIGHSRTNLNKNKNKNLLDISRKNMTLELKKIIQKIDNKTYPNFEKEFSTILEKKFPIIGFRFSSIKHKLLNWTFEQSKINYYFRKYLNFLNYDKNNKTAFFLDQNKIKENKYISKEIKKFTNLYIEK